MENVTHEGPSAAGQLTIGGSTATRGSPFGGGSQLASWGEKGDVSLNLINSARSISEDTPAIRVQDTHPGTRFAITTRSSWLVFSQI
jgi:hypothetical protein